MLKKIFLIKSDISNFSEFYQDYEYADLILFGESWNFANFVTVDNITSKPKNKDKSLGSS